MVKKDEKQPEKPLRILRLESENVKRLRAVQITPKGDVVQITGANDNGKTSVLDSIFLALKQTMVDAPMPLREGTTKGRILLDLGGADGAVEFVVERILGKGAGLSVRKADGAKLAAPQSVLDALVGALTFDPLAFTRMKPKEQYDELRRCVKLEVDVDNLAALNATDFDRRTAANRHAKERRAEAEGISIPEAPEAAVELTGLLDQIESAAQHNANIENLRRRLEDLTAKAGRMETSAKNNRDQAAEMRAHADALEVNATKWEADASDLRKTVKESTLPGPRNVSELRAELDKAQAGNSAHAARKAALEARQAAITAAERHEAAAAELTASMKARDEERAKAISAAKMPVDGLGFGDGIVTYKGVPFQQASSAVALRVSLGIAMASNPRLRIARIQDGSLLDENSLELVAQLAAEHDFQIWMERVDSSGAVGIFIEDGSVKAVDGVRK